MKKVFLFLAIFVASAMIMTSCGGSETAATEGEDAAAVEETTEATTDEATDEATEAVTEEATTEEATTEEAAAVALGDATHGAEVYNTACTACHGAGIAGAAKLDDKAAWEASAANGLATVYDHAINGFTGDKGMMPAKGGNASLTDQDVHDAVTYMFEQAGVEVK